MTVVVLAEKPDQAKKYAHALGQARFENGVWRLNHEKFGDMVIVNCFGHITQLVNPFTNYENWNLKKLPVLPKEFSYELTRGTKKIFDVIKREVDRADVIIIATDPAREGEAIAYQILKMIPNSLSKVKWRLWTNSLTVTGIRKAFNNLRPAEETKNYYHEANARRIADWLVGFNLSPFATIMMKNKGLIPKTEKAMSVGRVQTPIVSSVVDNDDAIANFQSIPYYKVRLSDKENEITFTNKETFLKEEEAEKFSDYLSTSSLVAEILSEEKADPPPELFDLNDLQVYMSKVYKWHSDKTLTVADSLYLKGVTTYPRTDGKTITSNEFAYLNQDDYINSLVAGIDLVGFEKAKETVSTLFVDDEMTEDHHAIITTEVFPYQTSSQFSDDEVLLYKEISKRTLLMFESDFEYESTKIVLDNHGQEFATTGNRVINLGWKKFALSKARENFLPNYELGELVDLEKIVIADKTKPPKRLTEATLFSEILKKHQLGTSATRAKIFKMVLEKNYIKRDKKNGQLFPSERGRLLIQFLKSLNIMYTNLETTAIWEKTLKQIGEGKFSEDHFLLQVKMAISKQIGEPSREETYKELGRKFKE